MKLPQLQKALPMPCPHIPMCFNSTSNVFVARIMHLKIDTFSIRESRVIALETYHVQEGSRIAQKSLGAS
jgi:hypothetical protein